MVASGHCSQKLEEVLDDVHHEPLPILALSAISPLPENEIVEFAQNKTDILVLEEHHPVVSDQLKALGLEASIHSSTGVGELYRYQIRDLVERLTSSKWPGSRYRQDRKMEEIPVMKSHCGQCRYDEVLDKLDGATTENRKPFYIGDPGCLVTVTDRLHVKMAMGGAVAIAAGLARVESSRPIVALFGDSSFFHSTIPAICDAYRQQANILLVLLDNETALTTGGQQHPGTPNGTMPPLSPAEISRACGVTWVEEVHIDAPAEEADRIYSSAFAETGLRLLIVKIPTSSG